MIKQILAGLVLGLIIIIIALPHNPYIKRLIDDGFKQAFADALDCNIECTVDKINFLKPGLELSNVMVTPRNGAQGWKWTAKKYDMYCSWWHLITKGIVNLHVDMNEVDASSDIIKGELAILPHLQRMAVGDPNVPMSTDYINLQKATFSVIDPQSDMRYSLTWKSKTIKQGDRLESRIHIIDGDITHQLKKYISNVKGNLFCGVNEAGNPELVIDGDVKTTINYVLNQSLITQCKLQWNYDQGAVRIIHDDQILQIKECSFKTVNDVLHAHATLEFELKRLSALEGMSIPVMGKGTAVVNAKLDKDPQVSVEITGTDFGYDKKIIVSSLFAQGAYKNNQWSGLLKGQTKFGPLLLNIKNKKKSYAFVGSCDGYVLDAEVSYGDTVQLDSATIKDNHQKTIITASSKNKEICIKADLEQLSKAVKKYTTTDLYAEGLLTCQLSFKENLLFCDAKINKGFIRIPETFNGITQADITASFNHSSNTLSLHHATITLNEGSISCKNGMLTLDNNGAIESYYANALIDHALFNVLTSIDLYCSGNVTVQKKGNNNPILSGHIILDEFQLRQNPLSTSFINKIMQAASTQPAAIDIAIDCDLSIATKKPITVTTPWLAIEARANVWVKNNFVKPALSGSIILDNGILHLPYKPLMISNGKVTFDPEHIDNPFIELTAHNTIKHHEVSMQIAGPLQQLNISLLSNPVLSETQIIALLLTGSAYGSLGMIVPSLALYSMKNLLFDIEQSPIKLSTRTQEWLKPLRSVYFVPLFDDQRARGGLRGAFEIEVTDRIHALIQKNFTLTEDTRFELEYSLSDNMSIRAVRDERRDVNGQVEMRWKF